MQPFTETLNEARKLLRITLEPADNVDWPIVATHLRGKLDEGVINFELDIRRLKALDSLGLGMLVGLNISTVHRGGTFRLVVERNTPVHELLLLTKMNLLLTIVETGV